MKGWLLAGLTLAAVVGAPCRAGAHAQPYSWIEIRVSGGSLVGSATAHVVDLVHEAGGGDLVPESLLADGAREKYFELHNVEQRLADVFERALQIDDAGGRVRPRIREIAPDLERHAFTATFVLPPGDYSSLVIHGPLFTWEPVHETYVNVYVDGALAHQDLLDARHSRTVFVSGVPPRPFTVIARFVREGIHHIGIGPDHILFIVGLLLLGGSVRRLATIVSGFTIAHSITLALATLGILQPPARVIEPLIALSIVIVGVENLVHREGAPDRRAWLAFAFGFVHGFGFAGVLRELELPRTALGLALVSFNVGVEIAQLAIVLAVAPALGWLRARHPGGGRFVLVGGSAAVIAAGAFWLVQRLLAPA